MKTTKLMLSALIAAAALVSCNKENHTPVDKTGLKSVSISIDNAIMTKTPATDQIGDNTGTTKVKVNNLKVFLLDEHGHTYSAKNLDGTDAPMYFDFSNTAIKTKIEYHFIDPAVTEVVAFANVGNLALNQIPEVIKIGDEQDADDLTLFGSDDTLAPAGEKTHADGKVTVLYTADITLAPRISRFEIDGFRIKFTGDTPPDYDAVTISKVAFQNYYPETTLATGVEVVLPNQEGNTTGRVQHIKNLESDASVFDWFNSTAATPAAGEWYWDAVNATFQVNSSAASNSKYYYHFFSCNHIPVMVIDLVADGRPAYIYTKSFNTITQDDEGNLVKTPLTTMEEGKIYRMHAGTTVTGTGDGIIEIPEEVITPANHCIDINVEVVDWVVTLVQPVF